MCCCTIELLRWSPAVKQPQQRTGSLNPDRELAMPPSLPVRLLAVAAAGSCSVQQRLVIARSLAAVTRRSAHTRARRSSAVAGEVDESRVLRSYAVLSLAPGSDPLHSFARDISTLVQRLHPDLAMQRE